MGGRRRRWIQRAIKRPGALTRWARRNRRTISAATKSPVFTKSGKLNINTLRKFRKTEAYERVSPTVKRRINLAITLRKLGSRRRKS